MAIGLLCASSYRFRSAILISALWCFNDSRAEGLQPVRWANWKQAREGEGIQGETELD